MTASTEWGKEILKCEAKTVKWAPELTDGTSVVIHFHGQVMPGRALLCATQFMLNYREDVISFRVQPTIHAISATDDEWRQFGEAVHHCPRLRNITIAVDIPKQMLLRVSYRGKRSPVILEHRCYGSGLNKEEGNAVLVIVWLVGIVKFHKSTFPLPVELIRVLRDYILYDAA